jgi:hypothetical protein
MFQFYQIAVEIEWAFAQAILAIAAHEKWAILPKRRSPRKEMRGNASDGLNLPQGIDSSPVLRSPGVQ